jgi:hypothetical protein
MPMFTALLTIEVEESEKGDKLLRLHIIHNLVMYLDIKLKLVINKQTSISERPTEGIFYYNNSSPPEGD